MYFNLFLRINCSCWWCCCCWALVDGGIVRRVLERKINEENYQPDSGGCDVVYAMAIGDDDDDSVDDATEDQLALPTKGKFTFAVSLKWVRGHKSCTFLWLQSILKFNTISVNWFFSRVTKGLAHGSPSLLFVSWIFGRSFISVTRNIFIFRSRGFFTKFRHANIVNYEQQFSSNSITDRAQRRLNWFQSN